MSPAALVLRSPRVTAGKALGVPVPALAPTATGPVDMRGWPVVGSLRQQVVDDRVDLVGCQGQVRHGRGWSVATGEGR